MFLRLIFTALFTLIACEGPSRSIGKNKSPEKPVLCENGDPDCASGSQSSSSTSSASSSSVSSSSSSNSTVPTAELLPPTINPPVVSGTSVSLSWSSASNYGYLIRAKKNTATAPLIVYENNWTSTSQAINNLEAGAEYIFWIHSKGANFDQATLLPRSASNQILFTAGQASSSSSSYSSSSSNPSLPLPCSADCKSMRVGSRELLYSNFDLQTEYDMSAATLKIPGTDTFFTWVGNGSYSFKKQIGTLSDPFKTLVWSERSLDLFSGLGRWDFRDIVQDFGNSYNSGRRYYRPWMANIYKHTDGTLIGIVHVETDSYADSNGQINTNVRYRQGIAVSFNNGDKWKYLGDVLKPEYDGFSNLGGTPLLIVGDYLYQYYNELPKRIDGQAGHGPRVPSVARAKITDVVNAAIKGTVSPWIKYNKDKGGWTQNGLTGVGSNITPSPDRYDMHTDAVYSTALRKYILVAWEQAGYEYVSPFPISQQNKGLYIYTSTDGLNWGNRIKAYTPLLSNEENPYPFFTGGLSHPETRDDMNVIGGNTLYLNFPDRINHKFYRVPIFIE